MDIYFLSRQPSVFYNATLETTACAFREKVEDIAFDRSCLLVRTVPVYSTALARVIPSLLMIWKSRLSRMLLAV